MTSITSLSKNVLPHYNGIVWWVEGPLMSTCGLTEAQCAQLLRQLGWEAWEVEAVMDFEAAREFLAWANRQAGGTSA